MIKLKDYKKELIKKQSQSLKIENIPLSEFTQYLIQPTNILMRGVNTKKSLEII